MCGIAGLVYRDPSRQCEESTVLAMRDVMPYRGPDDAGLYVSGPVGLGHRRLSIIDLGGGHQPMANAASTHWIIFNGEIYNYRELRQDLLQRGHTFRTQSDTEVILALYAERGERCVEAMNGMFAFAIWDAAAGTLFLARDRMGVKPLYYAETSDAFVFGSEIKALFASGLVKAECRRDALAEYLVYRQVAGDQALFAGVRSLPPGCTMTLQAGEARVRRYWSPLPDGIPADLSYEAAVTRLSELLDDAVRLRLISDVPVGTFCSGGVDSSLVTAIAARRKGEGVNTYSVGFDEPDFDESAYAEQVAAHCRTRHHRLTVGNVEFDELLPRMIWHNDEPLDFANSVQIFALSRLSKQEVTVVLTGEGSDELFAGYPRYRIPDLSRSYRLVPRPVRRALTAVGDHRFAKLDRYASTGAEDALLYNASYLRPELVAELAPSLPPASLASRRASLEATASLPLDTIGRVSLLDQQTFLIGILHRQDKMSMAASIESRVPFMDYRVVEFANRLPSRFKVRRGSGKAVVKDVARTLLPPEIVDRRKSGFGVPLARWFRSNEGLGARLNSLADSAAADVFDGGVLQRLVREHRSGAADHSELLWTALNVALWRDAFSC
ncbi:MAG TPA: asparagine synthase (glutamine-hydrolyzing) [Vicinamibacterales bacterium]|nr:asparagine synthase (glutamine-hydrolyzing) [Vicinamibacterales bacterium]